MGLGLPDWDRLLSAISADIDGALSYDKIKDMCQGDPLMAAEYLYLKSDRSIGPLRHGMAKELRIAVPPITSTAHIELININAPQIYTTNFDEAIEETFLQLSQPYYLVALPKHVSTASGERVQIVKYHGDLRHDHTLVLTESSYYNRLNFESPMDLKFRSDLLGRSVLFMGYSFRDINIRIIWFRLMEMMRDVPQSDRPSSFIVRFERNPVLEELYRGVGIQTICIDPEGTVQTPEQRTKRLGTFLRELTSSISDRGKMPGGMHRMYVSKGLLDEILFLTEKLSAHHGRYTNFRRFTALLETVASRRCPVQLVPDAERTIRGLVAGGHAQHALDWVTLHLQDHPDSTAAALCLSMAMLSEDGEWFDTASIPWKNFLAVKFSTDDVDALLEAARVVVDNRPVPEGFAYVLGIIKRIGIGRQLENDAQEASSRALEFLSQVRERFSGVDDINVDSDESFDVHALLKQIVQHNDVVSEDAIIPF